MAKQRIAGAALLLAVLAAGGCALTDFQPSPASSAAPQLARAETLLRERNYTAALIECIELSRRDPLMPGLADLQQRIMNELSRERARIALQRQESTYRRTDVDTDRHKALPDTYGLRRLVAGETQPLRSIPSPMQQALQSKVTVHLDGATLDKFILALGASENINIIADGLESTRSMTVHAQDAPLIEILDYVSRNLGIAFYVGENVIWATPQEGRESGIPMLTRMYRLRRGLANTEIGQDGSIDLMDAIQRFVPQPEGADLFFSRKAHTLIVRNSRQNLNLVEDLVDRLDVCPPQVLIEARFITTSVSDMRELGVDWILNSPIRVSETTVGGSAEPRTRTQIDEGGAIRFGQTGSQGLNLSYSGLLTDPEFQATLHALETSGKARTLSVPKITTINNRPALIRIGTDFRYYEEYAIQETLVGTSAEGTQTYRSEQVPVGTPTLEELGIQLNVTPSVGADLSGILLRIEPEISEFLRWEYWEVGARDSTSATVTNALSTVKLPIFTRRKLETEVVVQSGETVAMGGLIASTEGRSRSGVPILSAIPFIGSLFRHDKVEENKENLLIFVTATILSQQGESLIPVNPETVERVLGGASASER